MAAPIQPLITSLVPLTAAGALVAVPLLWVLLSALRAGADTAAWAALIAEPGLLHALALTLWTGLAATAVSLLLTRWLLARCIDTPLWQRLVGALAPMLALPHAALAIGLVALIAPSGWLLRLASPWLTGLNEPPPWPLSQDPWGLGLIAALVLKETPFLLWNAAAQLQRADAGARARRDLQVAQTLGYSRERAFALAVWPVLRQRLRWPLLAVLAYALTVVDMALIAGPGHPPTLAVLCWQWLLDADPARNAQGAAGAWLLTATVALCALLALAAGALARRLGLHEPSGRRGAASGSLRQRVQQGSSLGALVLLPTLYLAVAGALALGSVTGVWRFPALWPQSFSTEAWQAVAASSRTLGTTLGLALASAALALAWSVLWLEAVGGHTRAPRHGARADTLLRALLVLPLALPPLLWTLGTHGLVLRLGLDATHTGLLVAHTLSALPYVLIALTPAYAGFDARAAQVAATLGHGRLFFLWRIKWPLLRAALTSAFAIGVAVSVAQYMVSAYIGGGRIATVTTEAVAMASGGQRALAAAYAALQALLPWAVFALAAWLGRPRRFAAPARTHAMTGAAA